MRKKLKQKENIERVCVNPTIGLSDEQVNERIKKGYANIQNSTNEKSAAMILRDNLFTFFNIVLFFIALVFLLFVLYFESIGRADVVNSYFGFSKFFFLCPALINVAIGTFQEIRSLKTIKKLRIVTETKCKAVRNGKIVKLEAKNIVIDDIIVISAGDQATADLEVLSGEVYVDESMLTGESDNVKKLCGDTILSGSFVIIGEAKCRAKEVGDDTYAARLSQKVKSGARHQSELMTSIIKIIKVNTIALLLVVSAVTATLIFKISSSGNDPSIWNGLELSLSDPLSWGLIAVTSGSFGIGVIPSGLVLTTSVTMLVSIARLAKEKTLIQELYSLENLSRIDVICLDKTGTLTDGTMEVVQVRSFISDVETARYARDIVSISEERNATAEAIFNKFGINNNLVYKEKIPFSSETKCSGLVYDDGRKLLMGAPEYLLDKDDKNLDFVTERAKEGFRVIALTIDKKLIAFIVMEDHIRDTAADTLRFFRENGVEVKIISGDNPLTVSKIAADCKVEHADRYISLENVPLEEIDKIAEEYTVFARVSPEQKEELVKALQKRNHKVAMTGDGVNDILALRKANSSITFANATDAAKSCSDVVLLDNDFSHLKDVVGEGRRVIGNIQRTSVLYLMKSVAVFLLGFAFIPFDKAQMWFSIENMYMFETTVVCTGGFLLSLEPRRVPIKGSFIKKVAAQSITAGILAAISIVLPVMLYCVPTFFGHTPFIALDNVKPMMTVLMAISGIVVAFSMCIPFTRYRAIAMALLAAVATLLGFALPSAYIAGNTIGKQMISFDASNGQTILDSQIFKEFFRPWNSETIKNLFSSANHYFVIRIFLYISIPTFIFIMFAAEKWANKDHRNHIAVLNINKLARKLILASSIVLTIHSLMIFIEFLSSEKAVLSFNPSLSINHTAQGAISIAYILLYLVLGVLGYAIWKKPSKKITEIIFSAAIMLMIMAVASIILSGGIFDSSNISDIVDKSIIYVVTICYISGALISRLNYKKQKAVICTKS